MIEWVIKNSLCGNDPEETVSAPCFLGNISDDKRCYIVGDNGLQGRAQER